MPPTSVSRTKRQAPVLAAGVANPEMTFADVSEDPIPKRRKQSKAGKKSKADEEGQTEDAVPADVDAAILSASLGTTVTEPAQLSRTGAAEVAADAEAGVASPPGMHVLLLHQLDNSFAQRTKTQQVHKPITLHVFVYDEWIAWFLRLLWKIQ